MPNRYGAMTNVLLKNEKGIPNMDLTAVVVAVKADKMRRQEFQVNLKRMSFWMVMKYINKRTLTLKTFVTNRLAVIQEITRKKK